MASVSLEWRHRSRQHSTQAPQQGSQTVTALGAVRPQREVQNYREIAAYLSRARYVTALCDPPSDHDTTTEYGVVIVPAGREAELLGNWIQGSNSEDTQDRAENDAGDAASVDTVEFCEMERRTREQFIKLQGKQLTWPRPLSYHHGSSSRNTDGVSPLSSPTGSTISPIIPPDYLCSTVHLEAHDAGDHSYGGYGTAGSVRAPRTAHLDKVKSIGDRLPACIRNVLCAYLRRGDKSTSSEKEQGEEMRSRGRQEKSPDAKRHRPGTEEQSAGGIRQRRRWSVEIEVEGSVGEIFYGMWSARLATPEETRK